MKSKRIGFGALVRFCARAFRTTATGELFRSIADLMLLMGDTLEAGKYYLLSVAEPNKPELTAMECFLFRYRKSGHRNLIGLFPPQSQLVRLNRYPAFLQNHLRQLGAKERLLAQKTRFLPKDKLVGVVFIIAFIVFISLALLGFVTAMSLIFGFVR